MPCSGPSFGMIREQLMKITGSYVFDATVAQVWETLMSPDLLSSCIPGCQGFEPLGKDEYRVTINIRVGPINGRYEAKIALTDQNPPDSYRLVAEGSGPLGFAKGDALVTLAEADGKTTLHVEGDANVGGTVARIGQRMTGSVAKTMMDRFFACLRDSAN
jgi:carbon monoxide dehydrogenase subunit G